MKFFLVLTLYISFASCSKKSDSTPIIPKGTYTFKTTYKKTLPTGQIEEELQPLAILLIWKANKKDFVIGTHSDLSSGYLLDNNSNKSFKYDEAIVKPGVESRDLLAGRYFMFISTGIDEFPFGMYSYTYFDIRAGEVTQLKKVFKTRKSYTYESW
jgi:hypothetical protein